MGQDYRLAHPLTKACSNEMQAYKCVPQPRFEHALQFHLSWVLLCLDNGVHYFKQQKFEREQKAKDPKVVKDQLSNLMPFSDQCQYEMLQHREMMVREFRMSPELVMSCVEVHKFYFF